MKKICTLLLVLSLTLASLTGCAAPKTHIAYTVYPLGYIVQRISQGRLTAETVQTNTIAQRAEPVDNLGDILAESLVFLHVGTLEPYYEAQTESIKASGVAQLDLSSMNAIYLFQRYTRVLTDGIETYIESPYYNDPSFDSVDVDTRDLHLWIDPIAMLSMAKDVMLYLSQQFPDDANTFQENYIAFEEELVELDAQYQNFSTSLATNNQEVKFVSMTASFGNWQKTYGFQVYPVILSKYGTLPTEEQLAVIKARIQADQVKYIAYEPNMTEDMIVLYNQLKDELGLTEVSLSNLSSLTKLEEDNNKDYLSIMYENLNTLETMATDMVAPTSAPTEDEANTEEESNPEQTPEATSPTIE